MTGGSSALARAVDTLTEVDVHVAPETAAAALDTRRRNGQLDLAPMLGLGVES